MSSCHQEIAADGAFAAAMLAEFEPRLAAHGPWFYRRLHWEAGAIGQVLYLEAEAAGFRVGHAVVNQHQQATLRDESFQMVRVC